MGSWQVRLYSPLPEAEPLLDAPLSWSQIGDITETLTGFESASLQGETTIEPEPGRRLRVERIPDMGGAYQAFGHAEIDYGSVPVFEGRMTRPMRSPFGEPTGAQLLGYPSALTDTVVLSDDETVYAHDDLIKRLVQRHAPLFEAGQIEPVGGQLRLVDVHTQTPYVVLDGIAKQGDEQGNPLVWRVQPGRRIDLVIAAEPDVAEVQLDVDPKHVTRWDEEPEWIISEALVRYQNTDTGQDATEPADGLPKRNPYLSETWPLSRMAVLEGGALRPIGAKRFLDTYLRVHSRPSVNVELTFAVDEPVMLYPGGLVPAYAVPCGLWISVGGQGPWQLTKRTIRVAQGETVLTVGTLETGIDVFRRLRTNDALRAARVNVITGSRERTG